LLNAARRLVKIDVGVKPVTSEQKVLSSIPRFVSKAKAVLENLIAAARVRRREVNRGAPPSSPAAVLGDELDAGGFTGGGNLCEVVDHAGGAFLAFGAGGYYADLFGTMRNPLMVLDASSSAAPAAASLIASIVLFWKADESGSVSNSTSITSTLSKRSPQDSHSIQVLETPGMRSMF
jgi:hypothetical protein